MFGIGMTPQPLPRTMAPQTPGGIANLTGTPMAPNKGPQGQGGYDYKADGYRRGPGGVMYNRDALNAMGYDNREIRDMMRPAPAAGPRTMTGSPVRDITPPAGFGMAPIGPRSVPTPVMGAPSPLPRDPMLSQQTAGAGPSNPAIPTGFNTGFSTGMNTAPGTAMFGGPMPPPYMPFGFGGMSPYQMGPFQPTMGFGGGFAPPPFGGMNMGQNPAMAAPADQVNAYQQFLGQQQPQAAPAMAQQAPMGMAGGGQVNAYDDYLTRLRAMR